MHFIKYPYAIINLKIHQWSTLRQMGDPTLKAMCGQTLKPMYDHIARYIVDVLVNSKAYGWSPLRFMSSPALRHVCGQTLSPIYGQNLRYMCGCVPSPYRNSSTTTNIPQDTKIHKTWTQIILPKDIIVIYIFKITFAM